MIKDRFSAQESHAFLGLILRNLRQEAKLQQGALAERAGVSQTRVSNAERLSPEQYVLGRRALLRIVTNGLQLPVDDANALLWLAREPALTPGEIIDRVQAYNPDAQVSNRPDSEHKETILRMLGKIRPSEDAPVDIFLNSEQDRFRSALDLLVSQNQHLRVAASTARVAIPRDILMAKAKKGQLEMLLSRPGVAQHGGKEEAQLREFCDVLPGSETVRWTDRLHEYDYVVNGVSDAILPVSGLAGVWIRHPEFVLGRWLDFQRGWGSAESNLL